MRKILKGMMMATVILVIGLSIIMPSIQAGYDYDTPLGPDAIDALMPIPAETAKKFGRTEKVRLCYNIAELLKEAKTQQVRIDALEKQVSLLNEKIEGIAELSDIKFEGVDPNEAVK